MLVEKYTTSKPKAKDKSAWLCPDRVSTSVSLRDCSSNISSLADLSYASGVLVVYFSTDLKILPIIYGIFNYNYLIFINISALLAIARIFTNSTKYLSSLDFGLEFDSNHRNSKLVGDPQHVPLPYLQCLDPVHVHISCLHPHQ